ncbi:MAG TPA: phosphoribosyltransferase family protein [Solirubrobacterales bacterium]|jgi:predicted amidophosphoribosyltransferase|nr:phosphoribosyltransferase family protein [Solirubrobacterales bacterium]
MKALHAVVAGLLPTLCAACGRSCRPGAVLCNRCSRRLAEAEPLAGNGPPGLDRAWSSAAHEGVARDLVASLKFRRLLPVADLIAERIEWLAPASLLSGAIVPAPTARLRTLARGFDPATEIAAALAQRLDAPLRPCLVRSGGGRQVGKSRAQRIGHPPHVSTRGEVPRSVLLLDDVLTTGATLSACARALRSAGAIRVAAITFTRRL